MNYGGVFAISIYRLYTCLSDPTKVSVYSMYLLADVKT